MPNRSLRHREDFTSVVVAFELSLLLAQVIFGWCESRFLRNRRHASIISFIVAGTNAMAAAKQASPAFSYLAHFKSKFMVPHFTVDSLGSDKWSTAYEDFEQHF